MAEPQGQCLCESDSDIKYHQGIRFLQSCHEKRRMASLPVGTALQPKAPFVHHTISLELGCCVARGLHSLGLASQRAPDAAARWAIVRAPGQLQLGR